MDEYLKGQFDQLARLCQNHFEDEHTLHIQVGELKGILLQIKDQLIGDAERIKEIENKVVVIQAQHDIRMEFMQHIAIRIKELEEQNVKDAIFRYLMGGLFVALCACIGWVITTLYQTHWPALLEWISHFFRKES